MGLMGETQKGLEFAERHISPGTSCDQWWNLNRFQLF